MTFAMAQVGQQAWSSWPIKVKPSPTAVVLHTLATKSGGALAWAVFPPKSD